MGALKLNEISFVEDKNVRDQYINKTEVLNKVKLLTLLPDGEHMTIRQISEYYEVGIDVVRKVIQRNKLELEGDGLKTLLGEEFRNYKSSIGHNVLELKSSPSTTLINKRSILRIGMLLRDSEVAKQIRTYLLNVEEASTKEQKTIATNHLATWTHKEELILLDCYYTTVLNGGSLNEASRLASERINHTPAACMNRYSTHIKEIITNDKFFEVVAGNRKNRKRNLSIVLPENKQTENKDANLNEFMNQISKLSSYVDNLSEENNKLLQDKIDVLENENNNLKSRCKKLIKEKKEIAEELNTTKAIIATAVQINVNNDIKNAFKMDRNGNLERV